MKNNEDHKEHDFLIQKRELNELFDSKYALNVNLWRGDNPHNEDSIFYPILKAFMLSSGRLRKEDIKTYTKGGVVWVDSKSGGISLFDKKGIPVAKWEFYKLLAGTEIPHGLVITKDDWKEQFQAYHYTIRPHWDMPLTKFLMLLDKLAVKLVKE